MKSRLSLIGLVVALGLMALGCASPIGHQYNLPNAAQLMEPGEAKEAADPNIESALGAALGGTGSAKDEGLKKLNAAITNDGWFIPFYETYIYDGYDSSKVAKPTVSPTYGYVLLSSVKPAS